MPISINGTGSITGLSAGGLPDACVTAADLASGAARSNFGAGAVLQVVQTLKTDAHSFNNGSATGFVDLTGLSATITPSSSSNKIMVFCSVNAGTYSNGFMKLVRGSSDVALGDAYLSTIRTSFADMYVVDNSSLQKNFCLHYLDSPSTISATTYKVQVRTDSASYPVYINMSYTGSNATYAQRNVSSITLMEIAA